MASGEEEVLVQESGTTRTRSTRAVSARKASRGRKKAATSPRATRSKRSTRATQQAESDEEEDIEAQSEPSVNTSEATTTEDSVTEEDNAASTDYIPEEHNVAKDDDKTEDGNSESGEDPEEEENIKSEKRSTKHLVEEEEEEEEEDDDDDDDEEEGKKEVKVFSNDKVKAGSKENNTLENGHDKLENKCKVKEEVKEELIQYKETEQKTNDKKSLKAVEDKDTKVVKKENGEEIDYKEADNVKQKKEDLSKTGKKPALQQEQSSPLLPDEPMEVESEKSKTVEKMEMQEYASFQDDEDKVMQESIVQQHTEKKRKEDVESTTVIEEVTKELAVKHVSKEGKRLEDERGMTEIDEVTDETSAEDQNDEEKANEEEESPFPTEPDTEMVSEDELPTESTKEPLETEAVSDEELPEPAAPVDLPETEAVSEDELPPEKVEKKRKKKAAEAKAADSSGAGAEGETSKKKVRSTEAQKRKLIDGDTYDPSSPTSENSCDETPAAKRAAVSSATGGIQAKPVTKARKSLPELEKYWKAVKEDPSDFTGWTYLLQYVDQENDIEAAREAYDAFLSHYPYCYGYWRKYADYEKRKGNKEKCEEVFERGLKAIPLSVDLWIHFLNYSKGTYADDEEHLRTQFEKAINACGMEFRSDRLWESYIKWETEGKRLQNVTSLYDRLLAMPTQGYTNHFDNFQEHIASNPPQKVLSVDEFLTLRREVLQQLKQYDTPATADESVPGEEVEAPPGEEPEEQPIVKTDEETTALRERIIAIRRKVHKATVSSVADRWNFEEGIKRPYFHVKPLERCQLKNWKEYLDYEIEQGDQERIVVLFERCLIACALYEEFWIKFVRYLESIKGEDVDDKIRNVYERACTIHHTKKPNLHLHWAVFEESHKNYEKASDILNNLEKLIPNMLQVAYRRINLERRRNNMDKVCSLYEHYISNTKNKVISNNMAIKYARFCWKVKGDVEKAISILNKAVEKDKENPRLYLQLIDMGLQKSPLNEEEIVSIIDMFLSRDGEPEQKVLFAQRKVEFLEDFGSDIVSVQKAHDEFQRYFKQAKDRKKKSPDLDKSAENASSSKKAKSLSTGGDGTPVHSHTSPQTAHSATGQQAVQASATAAASTSQYQATTYNQTGGYSQQPQAQGGYQGSQYPPTGPQQPPTPYNQPPYNQQYGQSSDPNYANYQNWGYSQTGYGGYNQGWGNYNYY